MGSNENEADKQRVFQLVYADDADALARELDRHQPEAWNAWRNFADRTLYQVAEKEGRGRCLELLRERLQALGFVSRQVPRVDYFDTTVEIVDREATQEIVPVTVPEVHFHKTLKYAPELIVTEVPEVVEVPRRTVKEELRIVEDRVSRPKHVTQTNIREEVDVRRILERREETTERPLPIDLAPVERITETRVVDIRPDVRHVRAREVDVIRDYEEVPFRHDVHVPKAEVKFVDRHEVRPREVTVQNVTEYPVIVEKNEVERRSVTLTDTEITRNIKYVPQLPMKTEWVPQGSQADTAQFLEPIAGTRAPHAVREVGGNTTNATLGGDDLWCELNLLRYKNGHLARMSARLKGNLDLCGERARQLRDQLARERQLRHDKERQALELERGVATVTHLTKLPVRILGSAEVDCFQSPHRSNQSTTFTSSFLQESAISRRSPFVTPERPGRVDPTLSS